MPSIRAISLSAGKKLPDEDTRSILGLVSNRARALNVLAGSESGH